MRSLDAAEILAIQAGRVRARDYVWIEAKDRETGHPVPFGFWSDFGVVSVQVVDGLTGQTEERVFTGSGALLEIGTITLTRDLSIRPVEVVLSHLHDTVNTMLRTYDVRGVPIQIYRGYLDESHLLVAPAKARFVGFVDEAPLVTPAEGGESVTTLSCVSHTRELTMKNPAVRSHEDQQLRAPGDTFFKDAATVGEWELFWGTTAGNPSEKKKKFLKSRPLR